MTELLNTIMDESTYPRTEVRSISEERARNIRNHLLPIIGGVVLTATLAAGGAYELNGPRKETGTATGTIRPGEGVIAAAEEARVGFEERTGIELSYTDVYQAAQISRGVADKNGIVQPGNIELLVEESPLLHRQVVTVTGTHSNTK